MVQRCRVLQHDDALPLRPLEAHLGDGGSAVLQQAGFVLRVGPRLRHHLGAVERADVFGVGLDELVEHGRVDEALLDQDRLERFGAQLDGQVGGSGNRAHDAASR
jgi:hypothetical protein